MATEDTWVTIASYDSVRAAEEDWEGAESWHESVYVADAALVTKDPEGRYAIAKRMKHRGWAKGLLVGAVVGFLFPPSLVAAGAVGAVSGAAIARLNRSLDKGDVKDLGAQLDASTTVSVVVTDAESVKPVMENLGRATGFANAQGEIDWHDENLRDEFTPVEGEEPE